MNIIVNGQARKIQSANLEALIAELEMADAPIATALNKNFIRAKDRAAAILKDGDEIEIVSPRQGG